MWTLLLVALLAAPGLADKSCSSGNHIDADTSGPYYWPSDWRPGNEAPKIKASSRCDWTVKVPSGYFAKLVMDGDADSTSTKYTVIDAAGNSYSTTNQQLHPYFLPSASFKIELELHGSGSLGFRIEWKKYPTDNWIGQGVDKYAIVKVVSQTLEYRFTAGTQVSLMPFAQHADNYFSLRNTLVFEGTDMHGKYINNLFNLYKKGGQWHSSGQNVFITTVEATSNNDKVLVQDYGYIKDISAYDRLTVGADVFVSVDPGNRKSGLATVDNKNIWLRSVSMDSDATLSVYYGSPNSASLQHTYSLSELRKKMPIEFKSEVVQFIVSKGKNTLEFSP